MAQDELETYIQQHEAKNALVQQELNRLESTRIEAKEEICDINKIVSGINRLSLDGLRDPQTTRARGSEVALALGDVKVVSEKDLEAFANIDLGLIDLLDDRLKKFLHEASETLTEVKAVQVSPVPSEAEKAIIEAFQKLSNLAIHMSALSALELEIVPQDELRECHRAIEAGTAHFL